MTKRILRTSEAAQYLGLSPSTLEKRRLSGDGPRFVRLTPKAIGYDADDLDRWVEARKAASNPESTEVVP